MTDQHHEFLDLSNVFTQAESAPASTETRAGSPAPSVSASTVREGSRVVIIGGGPGGYEAALVAHQLGARVALIERNGPGGAAVLTDVVPSKTLIASAAWLNSVEMAEDLGITGTWDGVFSADVGAINTRVKELAELQSADIRGRLEQVGITIIDGTAALSPEVTGEHTRIVTVTDQSGATGQLEADIVLIATGATPRELPSAKPDGKRILTWSQMYDLDELPTHLIVVGSGVTGAEFAGAYNSLEIDVTLVSSRDRVLPGEDEDAARLIEDVFKRRGMTICSKSRAVSARVVDDHVEVELDDGRILEGSHCLMAVGAVPNTEGIGLEEAGVKLTESGHIVVDRVSRTTAFRVYAAGDCTGVLPLASVASMQGRIAMYHALGDSVQPLDVSKVTANIFTAPEIATIGVTQAQIDSGEVEGVATVMPLARNPRAKMQGVKEGFIKLFASHPSRTVIGGVIVAPGASEYIFPISVAVTNRLTVDQLSSVFTIYPSLSGSVTEAARQLHSH